MGTLSRSAILEFIQDFDLKKPDGIVCFDATIHFHIVDETKTVDTEVQVITSDHLEVVYFVGPEITGTGLPDMISPEQFRYNYVNQQRLEIQNLMHPELIIILPKSSPRDAL